MKKLYNITLKKADGSFASYSILSADVQATEASVVAINAALAEAGEGSEIQNCNKVGQVDIDATV